MIDTIKRSKKRSNWQIKDMSKHNIYHLSYFESIIRPCLREIGADPNRKDIIINMRYESEEFDNYQIVLENRGIDEYGKRYYVIDSRLGDHLLGLRGYPNSWMLNKIGNADKIYLKFWK